MTLDRLILSNFKNYGETEVSFCANLNCLVGNNGAGKTNLLDAIYYLSFCKSYFNPIDIQNIRQGADYFAIHGHYGDNVASCVVRKAVGKQMKWNKKACKTLAEHIGRIPLVMICPNDQTLITGGSVYQLVLDKGYLTKAQLDKILDPKNMVKPTKVEL